ncbi:hypothetical protein BMI89_19760 [Thioclava sp. F36-7]|nr:hypothetical protein BMI89_19760 [Thioclava sp. F36-7]
MEIVDTLKSCDDPEAVLIRNLDIVQLKQQQRFAALPEQARSDPWIQARHQEIINRNKRLHDAALDVLRAMLKTSSIA